MRVLFIGGTGVISSACSQLAVEQGIELYLLNRGQTQRAIPATAHVLRGDIRDRASVERVLEEYTFDVVVDWIGFAPEHVEMDIELFRGRTGHYVFVSSASAYQKPLSRLPLAFWCKATGSLATEGNRLGQDGRDFVLLILSKAPEVCCPLDEPQCCIKNMANGLHDK